jgi:maleylpyruvate isomerase
MTPSPATVSDADQLRARLGPGARYDASGAPVEALSHARRGMAFFARHLNALPDEGLAMPSRIAGWHRAHLVAHVSLQARALAVALAALRGQVSDEDEDWSNDIDLAATLPPRALRHLFEHAHVHVNVEWRDLSTAHWARTVALSDGGTIPTQDLPMRQAGLLWWGAVALGMGASEDEIPASVICPNSSYRGAAKA